MNKKYIFRIIVILVFVITCITIVALNNQEDKKVIEEIEDNLEEKLEKCYEAIKTNYNYDEYKNAFNTIETENGKKQAYVTLDKAIKDLLNEVAENYTNTQYYKIYNLFKSIEEKEKDDQNVILILNTNKSIYYYNDYMRMAKVHEEKGEYAAAYVCYTSAIREISTVSSEKSKTALESRDLVKEKAIEWLKNEFSKKISEKDYSGLYSNYENLINDSDDELKALYEQFKAEKKAEADNKEKEKRKTEGVYIGMTKQQVLDSMWGSPEKINTTTTKYGVSEQWVYPNYNYLYFENGILTAIQN